MPERDPMDRPRPAKLEKGQPMSKLQSDDKTVSAPLPATIMKENPPSRVARRTRGQNHGPITRLMSPSDFGRVLKPFVFLDRFETQGNPFSGFGLHPHSGIATLTYVAEGSPYDGPARVLLGSYGSATSAIKAPSPMNYLAVHLKAGERWSYQPPAGHTVLWTALGMGSDLIPDELQQGELAALKPSTAVIEFEAQSDAEFVLGSAVPHDYDLVLGSHSVHTSTEALREAEARISE